MLPGHSTRLDRHFRHVLKMLADCERPHDPWGVVTASSTAVMDSQAWVNYRTANALARRGLVEFEHDPEGDLLRLTDAGREAARAEAC